jgi:hypothetical protein
LEELQLRGVANLFLAEAYFAGHQLLLLTEHPAINDIKGGNVRMDHFCLLKNLEGAVCEKSI